MRPQILQKHDVFDCAVVFDHCLWRYRHTKEVNSAFGKACICASVSHSWTLTRWLLRKTLKKCEANGQLSPRDLTRSVEFNAMLLLIAEVCKREEVCAEAGRRIARDISHLISYDPPAASVSNLTLWMLLCFPSCLALKKSTKQAIPSAELCDCAHPTFALVGSVPSISSVLEQKLDNEAGADETMKNKLRSLLRSLLSTHCMLALPSLGSIDLETFGGKSDIGYLRHCLRHPPITSLHKAISRMWHQTTCETYPVPSKRTLSDLDAARTRTVSLIEDVFRKPDVSIREASLEIARDLAQMNRFFYLPVEA